MSSKSLNFRSLPDRFIIPDRITVHSVSIGGVEVWRGKVEVEADDYLTFDHALKAVGVNDIYHLTDKG